MNRINRLVAVILFSIVTVGAVASILVFSGAMDPFIVPNVEEIISATHGLPLEFQLWERLVAIVSSVIVAAVLIALIIMELTPSKSAKSLQISSTLQGLATVNANSIEILAERTGLSNRSVTSLRCRVHPEKQATDKPPGAPAAIIIDCHPRLVMGSNAQEAIEDLQERIVASIQQLTGLTVVQVNVVNVKYESGEASRLMGG